ncbi:hypothetical protein PRIPAC_82316 [Pristionchus pacificus]|uniref:Uncharacterized protein n=1 Tax=Pristionchus pacificus TaxID=54126 RepID=A0A2A6CKR7_PRIPA|nr:hypothetical protein PRIPAC_82316 [Pristionchus pacificus]|eukprot:PDM78700.1 hypothetical protein PRIPAC_31279 [Pristionchus pacificus]
MRSNPTLCPKRIQILLCILAAIALLFHLNSSAPQRTPTPILRRINENKDVARASTALAYSNEDIVDFRHCSPFETLIIFVHHFEHPLALALADHPTATKNENQACLFIVFTDGGNHSHPHTWRSMAAPGLNHVVLNINDDVSVAPEGREIIVQASFEKSMFRPLLDFSLSPNVQTFNSDTWKTRPSIMPLNREAKPIHTRCRLSRSLSRAWDTASGMRRGLLFVLFFASLTSSTFCLVPPSNTFQARLLESLRAGCIPVVLSHTQSLPFQDQLEWRLASFRYPLSMLDFIPEMLEQLEKEDVMEMRRRGRVFLARIDDAQALSKSLVAALSERIQIDLPLRPPVPSQQIAPNGVFHNTSYKFTRITSRFGTRQRSASRSVGFNLKLLYSRARWSSGRDLTYTPTTLHDVPMMPGDAPFYEGTTENIVAVNGSPRLGLTRDEEQFTAIILTYDRDDGVKKIIEKLRNCPYLNKIIVVWNNLDRRPSGTWPEIHMPVEFILAERNTLLSRFMPYDRIETEAIVSLDDDIGTDQAELAFGFRMWRENRDRLVGFPDRYHKFENGKGMYGLNGNCEHSLILTGYTFVHKDLAMNYLVAHLTRKPPLKVIKKVDINNGSARSGLSSRGNHYKERDGCIQMLSALYGYNPLLFSQETARPNDNCVNGL